VPEFKPQPHPKNETNKIKPVLHDEDYLSQINGQHQTSWLNPREDGDKKSMTILVILLLPRRQERLDLQKLEQLVQEAGKWQSWDFARSK
jgi:hypothetical protein